MSRVCQVTGKRPVTGIWPWGNGKMPTMPTLPERFGITGTMISAVDLLKGLGVCADLDVAQVEGATGYIDTNYEGKAKACLDALKKYDLVYVHVEATDEAGHAKDLPLKIKCIEMLDERLPGHGEDVEALRRRRILIDGGEEQGGGTLLQIFSTNVIGPIFFEFIQRKKDEGFGEGNFTALFESMERDQLRRGVLEK